MECHVLNWLDDGIILLKDFWSESELSKWEKTIISIYKIQCGKVKSIPEIDGTKESFYDVLKYLEDRKSVV